MAPVTRHAVVWTEDGIRFRAIIADGGVEDIFIQPEWGTSGSWWPLVESGVADTAIEVLRIAGRAMQVDREQHEADDAV